MAGRIAGARTALLAHVQTWRPYTLWYVGLVGLAGAGLADGRHGAWRLAGAWLTPTLGWVGGHYLSDYFDRELDATSKPHRPIPSGRLRARAAVVCGVLCMTGVAVLAAVSGWGTTVAAGLAACGILAYTCGFKAWGMAGNLVRGALGALALLYGALVVDPLPGWMIVPFAVAFWAHDTSSNLVGTLRDVQGDEAGGYQTVPVRRGNRVAVRIALLLYCVAVAAMAGGAVAYGGSHLPVALVLVALTAALGFTTFATLAAHPGAVPRRTALRAHELLVVERIGLASAVIGLHFAPVRTALLLVAALAVTWWTQRRMRSGYEFGPGTSARTGTGAPSGREDSPALDPPLDRLTGRRGATDLD